MNVLVIGNGAWVDTSSLGNTFSNFFGGWENTNFYNIYFRGTAPQNNVCENYFSITDIDIVRNWFNPDRIGKRVYKKDNETLAKVAKNEKRIISYIHKFKFGIAYEVEDILWQSDVWKNNNLDKFIDEASPDIIFTFASGNNNIVRMIRYIKERTNAKIVTFIADDVSASYIKKNNRRRKRLLNNLEYLMLNSDKIYGITEELCNIYSKHYDKEVTILKKGCTEFRPAKLEYTLPLKMVYAGNLLYGREQTLIKLVNELDKYNQKQSAFICDIYTGTELDAKVQEKLNFNGTSELKGEVPYNVVLDKLAEADIVIHLESFERENIDLVRNSFSTKIIDCFQSSSLILAIGSEELASMKYLKNINGTFVVNDISDIENVLENIVASLDSLGKNAEALHDFALANHDANANRLNLQKDFRKVITIDG